MALSKDAKYGLEVAIADRRAAAEIADAIDSGSNPQAAAQADLAVAPVGSTDGSGGAGDAALAADVDARFNTVEASFNALIDKLQAAGLMAS